jgi:hypothetical protein
MRVAHLQFDTQHVLAIPLTEAISLRHVILPCCILFTRFRSLMLACIFFLVCRQRAILPFPP